jgi:hypothetical protein
MALGRKVFYEAVVAFAILDIAEQTNAQQLRESKNVLTADACFCCNPYLFREKPQQLRSIDFQASGTAVFQNRACHASEIQAPSIGSLSVCSG